MSRASSLHTGRKGICAVTFDEPVEDLRQLGEKLQQALELTHERFHTIKSPELKLQAQRALDNAGFMYRRISGTVQTVERMRHFLHDSFGIDAEKFFDMFDEDEVAARVSARSAMVMINGGITLALNDLGRVNAAIDKELKNGK